MSHVPGTYLNIATTPEITQQLWQRSLTEVILRTKQLTNRPVASPEIEYVAKMLTASMPWSTGNCPEPATRQRTLWDFRDLDEIYLRFLFYLEKLSSPYVAEKIGCETLIWLGMIYKDRLKRFRGDVRRDSEFDFNDLTRSRKLGDFIEAGSAFFQIAANPRYRARNERFLLLNMAKNFGTWVNILAWVQANEFAERASVRGKALMP